jgi:hypothetical protein
MKMVKGELEDTLEKMRHIVTNGGIFGDRVSSGFGEFWSRCPGLQNY